MSTERVPFPEPVFTKPSEVRLESRGILAIGKVEAVEVVAVKYAPTTCPTTERGAYGEVVPIPTLPLR